MAELTDEQHDAMRASIRTIIADWGLFEGNVAKHTSRGELADELVGTFDYYVGQASMHDGTQNG